MDFIKYVKHARYYGNNIYNYYHKEVEKRFYEVIDKLGKPEGNDKAVFITLRLKGKSDWVSCNNASNALEWKLCKFFWRKKGKKMLMSGNAPFISSIESNHNRIKEHIHAIIRLKELKQDFTDYEIEKHITDICLSLKEVNSYNPEVVNLRIFTYCENTEKNALEVGNTIEYICKTSSKHYNPLLRKLINKKQTLTLL